MRMHAIDSLLAATVDSGLEPAERKLHVSRKVRAYLQLTF